MVTVLSTWDFNLDLLCARIYEYKHTVGKLPFKRNSSTKEICRGCLHWIEDLYMQYIFKVLAINTVSFNILIHAKPFYTFE
jgi:hypothetical protein